MLHTAHPLIHPLIPGRGSASRIGQVRQKRPRVGGKWVVMGGSACDVRRSVMYGQFPRRFSVRWKDNVSEYKYWYLPFDPFEVGCDRPVWCFVAFVMRFGVVVSWRGVGYYCLIKMRSHFSCSVWGKNLYYVYYCQLKISFSEFMNV